MSAILILVLSIGMTGKISSVEASSVSCKSKYYITTKISKSTLKKGKKAKVTVIIKNTSGDKMKTLNAKVTLPSSIMKKSSGSLTKTRSSLSKNGTWKFSFYIKAKKKITFKKTVITKKYVSGLKTTIKAKNLVKRSKYKKYMTIEFRSYKPEPKLVAPSSYAQSMISLLADMNSYAKKKNPSFAMVANGGYGLFMTQYNKDPVSRQKMLDSIDGALIENVFYGWDNTLNKSTDTITSVHMQTALTEARAAGIAPLNMEYCTGSKAATAISKSNSLGSSCYTASDLILRNIVTLDPARETTANVRTMAQVKNFMALLNPDKFENTSGSDAQKKANYLKALNNTNYDLIFIDLFFNGDPLTKTDVNSLKKKKNGKSRMVCAYVSVGEAESYRDYWEKDWNKYPPNWVEDENEDWEENYKVRYWSPVWQGILFRNPGSYLEQVINAGFDGAYLDVIDAYEYFEKKK